MTQTPSENLPVLQLDVISDVICPWCFIGKRKLDAALETLEDVRVNLMWRPYQLYPETPMEGADLTAKMKQRYGEDGAKQMRENIKAAAVGTNINFAFENIKITPNTMNAHRLIRWAASTGQQHAIAEALFSGHFEQGRNIGDVAVLLEIAGQHGMDVPLLAELFASDNDIDATRSDDAAARDLGVHGVPAFLAGGKFLLMGAQEPEYLHRFIAKARDRLAVQ
ncbi:MAG: DsbA family oxidoreductase [PS1 clade bacterium]|uniref:DsbA family oxidoreductase n=1 Tax=PS1 clade bacterium TaxID=2175152 RepID=A0A937L5I0_9PROT|nr:DsbA family oxidoreductase [PS1 clade bacterium]